jgi:hypothetical protein
MEHRGHISPLKPERYRKSPSRPLELSFIELWKNIGVIGTSTMVISNLPLDIDLEEGEWPSFSRGIFEAKQFSARSGKMQQSDGTAGWDSKGKTRLSSRYHVDADAVELHLFLFRAQRRRLRK